MRYLILSDVHGNDDALSAVLDVELARGFDVALVLGDLVGYGAGPNESIDALRDLPVPVYAVRGNHDKVAAGLEEGLTFNRAALDAARWTAEVLTTQNLEFLRRLPVGPVATADRPLVICHGSPLDEDAYILSAGDALEIFDIYRPRLTFFGHTHIASAFVRGESGVDVSLLQGTRGAVCLDGEHRYLLNPGSVGQPRDRDPRAAYMTYSSEDDRVEWYRVEYDIPRAQRRIVEAGLPEKLATRLSLGI